MFCIRKGLLGIIIIQQNDKSTQNLFVVLIYYLEVGNVGSGVIDGNAVYVNWTGDMAIVLFHSIFQTSAELFHARTVTFWQDHFRLCILDVDFSYC